MNEINKKKGKNSVQIGIITSLISNIGVVCYLYVYHTPGFYPFTYIMALFLSGIVLIPLLIWILVCIRFYGYKGHLLKWLLIPSVGMIILYTVLLYFVT